MSTFALITEGITDQIVLELLLQSHYSEVLEDEVDVRILQPLRDETDESRQDRESFGGWERVLEHCASSDRINEAIAWNDFIVIQIDTDCCEHPNFGVAFAVGGVVRSVAELISAVRDLIISKIGEAIFRENADKFIFAIAVHATECWLLPLHAKLPAQAKKIVSCEQSLRNIVLKDGGSFNKDYDCYRSLALPYRKGKNLGLARDLNESLATFLDGLPVLAAEDNA